MEKIINVTSAAGIDLTLRISGYRQEPKIEILAPAEIQGRRITGRARIGIVKAGGEEVIIAPSRVAIRPGPALEVIRDVIATLPVRVYRIYLKIETADLDGVKIDYSKYVFERSVPDVPDRYIRHMLEEAGITDISVDEAAAMWQARQTEARRPYLEEAQRTGKDVELSRAVVDCNDPREECSADIITRYIRPDGTIYSTRTHTY